MTAAYPRGVAKDKTPASPPAGKQPPKPAKPEPDRIPTRTTASFWNVLG
jgi:hypothetical protein